MEVQNITILRRERSKLNTKKDRHFFFFFRSSRIRRLAQGQLLSSRPPFISDVFLEVKILDVGYFDTLISGIWKLFANLYSYSFSFLATRKIPKIWYSRSTMVLRLQNLFHQTITVQICNSLNISHFYKWPSVKFVLTNCYKRSLFANKFKLLFIQFAVFWLFQLFYEHFLRPS